MLRIRSLLVACHVVAVYGCTIAQLQQESGQMTTRIADKEANLTRLESQRASLVAERQRLLTEIDTKQVTLSDLDAGLERIRQENSRLRSNTEQQQKEKERVEAEVQKLQAEARRLGNDDRLSEATKKERIEALKKQIKDYLNVMLTQ